MNLRLFFSLTLGTLLLFSCSFMGGYELKGYALVYGVADYTLASQRSLPLTKNDADDMEALLSASGYQVIKKTDSGASAAGIRQDFADIAAIIGKSDNFIFYFAGHGFGGKVTDHEDTDPESVREWIIPYQTENLFLNVNSYADLDTAWALKAISDDELNELMASIPSNKKLAVLDSCFSGGMISENGFLDLVAPNTWIRNMIKPSFFKILADSFKLYVNFYRDNEQAGVVFLTAAGEFEESMDMTYFNNGIFTYFLTEAGAAPDTNKDGYITVNELRNHIAYQMENEFNPYYTNSYNRPYLPHTNGSPVDFVVLMASP